MSIDAINGIFPTSPYADQFNTPEFQKGFEKNAEQQFSFQIQQQQQADERSKEDFQKALNLLDQ